MNTVLVGTRGLRNALYKKPLGTTVVVVSPGALNKEVFKHRVKRMRDYLRIAHKIYTSYAFDTTTIDGVDKFCANLTVVTAPEVLALRSERQICRVNITVKLTHEQAEKLGVLSTKNKTTRSALARGVIAQYLQTN